MPGSRDPGFEGDVRVALNLETVMGKVVRIVAPASTANLGPGFDCLGLALELRHRLKVIDEEGQGVVIRVEGEGADVVPLDESNVVYQAMARVFAEVGYEPGRLRLESSNDIPLACGLGSSAAAFSAGLAAGLLLSGEQLDRERLIEMGSDSEGHPDNIVPCVLGGFTVAVAGDGRVDYARLEPPERMRIVAVVPDFSLPTPKARSVLPRQVAFEDAVVNLGRVGLLTAAMASGETRLLRTAMEDVLHQPYRMELVPGLEEVRQAALKAGALGAALSGAGSTMMALVEENGEGVGRAMQAAWEGEGIVSRCMVLRVDRDGLQGEMNCGEQGL